MVAAALSHKSMVAASNAGLNDTMSILLSNASAQRPEVQELWHSTEVLKAQMALSIHAYTSVKWQCSKTRGARALAFN